MGLTVTHELFDTVDAMLDPAALSGLTDATITEVAVRPNDDHGGNAGSGFAFVDTNAGSFVLKTMDIASDWEMHATGDVRCRATMVWHYGLLDRVRPHLQHHILAGARDGDGFALLMADLSGSFAPDLAGRADLLEAFLHGLAGVHADHWESPTLHDERLGLATVEALLSLASRQRAQHESSGWGSLPQWSAKGWALLERHLAPDELELMDDLIEDPSPVQEALEQRPSTLLHGDFYLPNLAYRAVDGPAAFDWQLAMRSLATIDVARLANELEAQAGKSETWSIYRRSLETQLGRRFGDDDWRRMQDLGSLVDVLWITPFPVSALEDPDPGARTYAERRLERCRRQLDAGRRWLS